MKYEKKLIEGNFPCQEVGAETKRERDTGQAPPTHRLHDSGGGGGWDKPSPEASEKKEAENGHAKR